MYENLFGVHAQVSYQSQRFAKEEYKGTTRPKNHLGRLVPVLVPVLVLVLVLVFVPSPVLLLVPVPCLDKVLVEDVCIFFDVGWNCTNVNDL